MLSKFPTQENNLRNYITLPKKHIGTFPSSRSYHGFCMGKLQSKCYL